MKRLAILLSGRGSNFLAIAEAVDKGEIPARIVIVISNRADAPGLEHAKSRGYRALFIPSKGKDREAFDREVVAELRREHVDIVCLAGFMRLLSDYFVQQFPMRILNIHPSLLPAFPGLNAQQQAFDWGVRVSGCTVHFVDGKLDHGPIVVQTAVPVLDSDDAEQLSHRILEQEHKTYVRALQLVCSDRLVLDGRRVRVSQE